MSSDIRSILERLALVEGRTVPVSPRGSQTAQQERVPQLPALFKPRDISPTLKKKPYQAHPADGYMVGENSRGLAEAMQDIEEDMLSRVKGQFRDYLETLEKKNKIDAHLIRKAKAKLNIDDDPETEQADMEEAEWDADVAPVSGPEDAGDSETAHGIEDHVAQAMSQPTAPIGEQAPVNTYTMEDGTVIECWGDDQQGYELRRGEQTLPTRFKRRDDADIAVRLFQKRRQAAQQDSDQDYLEER